MRLIDKIIVFLLFLALPLIGFLLIMYSGDLSNIKNDYLCFSLLHASMIAAGLSFIGFIYTLIHFAKNKKLKGRRTNWIIGFIFMSMIFVIIYWVKFIFPKKKD